ncbi:hypothetical protein [Streptomyces sp. NPDC014734]|uniref:hypothetical protein n=1 Tax=Streptomyces sp. NPDC014734 TaxID=3364886 RepID=UPI003701FB9C
MTDAQPSPRALPLYPRRYRDLHGAEIQEMYRDAVEGAGRRARYLEELDIAAHAIRVRTRTSGRHRIGRFALTAAPYALAGASALAAAHLTPAVAETVTTGSTAALRHGGTAVYTAVLAAGVLACLGRWPHARALGAITLVPLAAGVGADAWLIPLLAVLVLMPGGAAPSGPDRRLAPVLAVLSWLPSLGAAVLGVSDPGLGMVGQLGPAAIVLAVRAAAHDGRVRHAVAVLVGAAPWIVTPTASPAGLAVVGVVLALGHGFGRAARPRRAAA